MRQRLRGWTLLAVVFHLEAVTVPCRGSFALQGQAYPGHARGWSSRHPPGQGIAVLRLRMRGGGRGEGAPNAPMASETSAVETGGSQGATEQQSVSPRGASSSWRSARLPAAAERKAMMEREDRDVFGGALDESSAAPGRLSVQESEQLGLRIKAMRGKSIFRQSSPTRGSPHSASSSHRFHSLKNALHTAQPSVDSMSSPRSSRQQRVRERDGVSESVQLSDSSVRQSGELLSEEVVQDVAAQITGTPRTPRTPRHGEGGAWHPEGDVSVASQTREQRKHELMDLLENLESKAEKESQIDDDRAGEVDSDEMHALVGGGLGGGEGEDVGAEEDDFDQEETVQRVKEHFRRQREEPANFGDDDGAAFSGEGGGGSAGWSGTQAVNEESVAESEFDWESLSEEDLRRRVSKILGSEDTGSFRSDRALHPRWYELMSRVGDLTEAQAALNVELRTAIKNGDEDEAESLIREGADVSKAMPDHVVPDGDIESHMLCLVWPPLHWAAALDHPSIIKLLVRMGADPNAPDSMVHEGRYEHDVCLPSERKLTDKETREEWNLQYNMTALHWAAFHGNYESVHMLCELGADVTLEDFRNRTAIEIAAYRRLNEHQRPAYDEVLASLKDRLIQQVGESAWHKWWPQLCNDTYVESLTDYPENVEDMNEEWQKFFGVGRFEDKTSKEVDIDKMMREAEAGDDPTIRKNEYYDRTVRDPQNQYVPAYIPGKPFFVS